MRPSQSVGSYEQAGELSCMEFIIIIMNCRKAMKTFVEKKQAGILPEVF